MSRIYEFSSQLGKLIRKKVDVPVMSDPRNDEIEDLRLGIPFDVIRREVLRSGLANFDAGFRHADYGELTADEIVLLYCFTNMKLHLFQCQYAFEFATEMITPSLPAKPNLLICDFGCGPGTAGLAFAELNFVRKWHYIGIDSSSSMRKKAAELLENAITDGIVRSGTRIKILPKWEDIGDVIKVWKGDVLLVFSYLFASHSLDPATLKSLADFVREIRRMDPNRKLVLLNVNSSNELANERYDVFRLLLDLKPVTEKSILTKIHYRTRKNSNPRQGAEFTVQAMTL